jgi:hypothetical protein
MIPFNNAFDFGIYIAIGIFSVLLSLKFCIAIWKTDLKNLFFTRQTMSHSKFWANIAYFCATVCFMMINLKGMYSNSIVELWLVFLGVVATSAIASKYISLVHGKSSDLSPTSKTIEETDKI